MEMIKSAVFVALLVTILTAFLANAQSPPPPFLGPGIGLNVNGTVRVLCPSATAATVIPNAQVNLTCGSTLVATTTTNSQGEIYLFMNIVPFLPRLAGGISSCRLVVAAAPTLCTPSLPLGTLTSLLQFVGTNVNGLLAMVIFLIPVTIVV